MHEGHEHGSMSPEMERMHYLMLGLNLLLSAIIMYLVMFTMIWTVRDFFNNLNTFYMALMMVAPMAVLMLLVMGSMYENRTLNVVLYIAFVALFVAAFAFTRGQTLIGDEQFLRSMIPHHAGAILMCEQAPIQESEIRSLCRSIIESQQSEINQMKAMLSALEK